MKAIRLLAALGLGAALLAVGQAGANAAGATPRVINGTPAAISDAPFIVSISVAQSGAPGGAAPWCGGSLIAPDKVLTAAHCVGQLKPSDFRISSGSVDRTKGTPARVTKAVVHPQYTPYEYGNDVAVLTLDRQLSAPVATLNTSASNERAGSKATVLGWGST